MKRLAKSLVLSAAVAATTLVPVLEASAGERWREQRPRHPQAHHRQDDVGNLVAAGILGLAVGAIAAAALSEGNRTAPVYSDPNPFPPAPGSYRPAPTYVQAGEIEPWTRDWYRYCSTRYRSFNPDTGTFRGYDGYDHFCVAN